MASSTKENKFPVPKFFFRVTLPKGTASFQEVTGLEMENESLEYRTGGMKELISIKRAGLRKSGTISLKKGVFKSDKALSELYKPILELKDYFSADTPKDMTIELLDEKEAVVLSWKVFGPVPIKLSNGDLKADENSFAIEQIDFVHAGIQLTVN